MEVIGEATDWETMMANAPGTHLDMLLVEWNLFPMNFGRQALAELRVACLNTIVVVVIGHLDACQQDALSTGADAFISKGDTPERVIERLQTVASSVLKAAILEDVALSEELLANDSMGG
jgi:DNA-binding NarL/FixJ family response regulator